MAVRWGAAGEDTLTACTMDFFPMDTLDETDGLSSEEALDALQSCLDPSILSIFEDTPTTETKGLDDESEATLLTALTEILDNVDDETLSPFDTLPDSDLLSGQKGREHSPLRRLLCLSRSPPEKDTLCSARSLSTGKSLPRIQADSLQRSDGEEEDDGSLSLSPVSQDSSPDNDLLGWEGLTLPLPVTFEQEGEDGIALSLGDLVRHMHPYCMAICVENDDGEQMLPEGGILLEVVDQGENGEPILAIPDMDLPVALPLKEQSPKNEQKVYVDAEEVVSDSSEHIVVDDDDDDKDETVSEVLVKTKAQTTSDSCLDVKYEMIIKRQKEEINAKSPSRRKKKKKCKKEYQPEPEPEPVEGRVLRSASVKKTAEELSKKPGRLNKKGRRFQVTIPLSASPERSQRSCSPTALSSQQSDEMPEQMATAPDKLKDSSEAPSAGLPANQAAPVSPGCPAAAPSTLTSQVTPPISEPLTPVALAVPEPKPKSLSLAEYRRLRQQKKPAPVEKQDDNSTKWPSLPELPKELPPIPCLPDPSPKDARRPNPQAVKVGVEEIRPAWQPRGPCAPPTPEALLVPPAYMVASSSKVSAATAVRKPQQTPEAQTVSTPKPTVSQSPSTGVPSSIKNVPSQHPAKAQPAVTCVPQSSGSQSSLKSPTQLMPSAGGKCPPTLSADKGEVIERLQSQPESPKSVELSKTCSKITTETIKPAVPAPSSPQSTVSQKVAEATAPTALNRPSTSSKPTTTDTQPCSSPAAHPKYSQSGKVKSIVLEAKVKATTSVDPPKAKSPTQELIEAFTSEIGIEAADLTSLLEQFEETQAKEEQCVPEVSGRAAAVGNSSVEVAPEKTVVDRVRANDLSSTAALTPPATPPHQMWKPLAPVALLGKSKAAEATKPSPSKVIQIEARPLPSVRSRSKPTPAAATVAPELACMDHDYCLPNIGAASGEQGKRWNVKQQSFITIKPIKQANATTTKTSPAAPESPPQSTINGAVTTRAQEFPLTEPLAYRIDGMESSSVLETPDASPARQENDATDKQGVLRQGSFGRSYRRQTASRTPSPIERTGGRSRKRRSRRSPSAVSSGSESDSHSSRSRSNSRSPSKKRYRPRHSESSSSSSSRSSSRSSPSVSRSPPRRRRYSYSSSRSGSWSRSRSRSKSPHRRDQWNRNRRLQSPSYGSGCGQRENAEEVKRRKEKAIEERRVVYVGRIRGTMTQRELKDRFSLFGHIEDCTLHFRDQGDNYGFVTYYNTNDAFTAIENGSKLRKPDELPFDLCFGGRRQFCQTSYADLDCSREYEPRPAKAKFNALDFDTLLKQAQQNQMR
ncbi:peroxisome proliferator-activated receptor gamma coactivator-related protein 1 [Scomber scombrus]|uniref:Peroxisome proliferator-activated receptor gamma coactivator-related protein 1 n=1 Tax=Scomber scombrus TaxID=13677 RepID=A0AAV1Q4R1_SCOSC